MTPNSRSYLNQFTQPDTIIPDPFVQSDWNRYAYVRFNPTRYTDKTGHWTEDELEELLGENWRDIYFGEEGIFAGRENLLNFLTSKNTTDKINLRVIAELFGYAKAMNKLGVNISEIDAIGGRFSGMYGLGGVAGLSGDVVLNLCSGELSYFVTATSGAGYGATVGVNAGNFLIKNLPTNNNYRGTGKAWGTTLAYFIGANGESFSGGKTNGNDNVYHGLYTGVVFGKGFSFYGSTSYTFLEALNVNQSGYENVPYYNTDFLGMATEYGDILWNDVFKFGDISPK